MKYLLASLALLMLTGCFGNNARKQAIANCAATIWEAAEAQRQGASIDATTHAIQSNASAIAAVVGATYPPEKKP